jgi:chromate reductase, NAD(P)H dehydrogenase (quinone)
LGSGIWDLGFGIWDLGLAPRLICNILRQIYFGDMHLILDVASLCHSLVQQRFVQRSEKKRIIGATMSHLFYTMQTRKKIVALSGSTRANSTNLLFIKAIAALAIAHFDVTIFTTITDLPHFNPDLDNENAPQQVTDFRNLLKANDGILICTPEYAMGVPGSLKNAIDWTVSSMEFAHKPTALITASSVGEKGHASLLETLHVLDAKMNACTELIIPFAKTKINDAALVTDEGTLLKLEALINALSVLMEVDA